MSFTFGFQSVSLSSRLSVQMFLIFFVFVTARALALPTGGDQSASPFLLRGGEKDICYKADTLKDTTECLQELLENYYGKNFTMHCPSLPLILASHECRGCPWDGVDASKVSPLKTAQVNRSELFHPARASCRIANHVEYYNNYRYMRRMVFGLGISGTLVLFFVTAYYSASSSSEIEIQNGATIIGFRMPEPAFLLTLWILYHVGNFLLIASEDYVEFCEGEAERMFQEAARLVFYAILLMISLKRCRAFQVVGFNEDVRSWARYCASPRFRTWKRFLSFIFGPVVTIFFLWALLDQWNGAAMFYRKQFCYAGTKNDLYFTIQILKISLEMLAVAIYTCGPSRKLILFYLRYWTLVLCLPAATALSILGVVWVTDKPTMMIPRVADPKIAMPLTNMVHVACVCAMGLLEPVRIGWPGRFKNQFHTVAKEDGGIHSLGMR